MYIFYCFFNVSYRKLELFALKSIPKISFICYRTWFCVKPNQSTVKNPQKNQKFSSPKQPMKTYVNHAIKPSKNTQNSYNTNAPQKNHTPAIYAGKPLNYPHI